MTPPSRRRRASPTRWARRSPTARRAPTCWSSGSSPASPKGHVNLSARAGYAIETTNTPVLAVPRGTEIKFSKPGIVKRVATKV